jgi:DNA polymerase-3 subunit delta'
MKNELLQRGIKEEFAFIAPLVTNNLDEAIDLCESEEFSTMLEIIYELGNIIANKYHTALIYFKENGDFIRRSNVDLFLNLLMYYYKDILNYQMNYELNFPFDRSLKIMRNIPRDEVMQNLEFILASRASLRYNPNINLMLDRVLAKLDWR